MFLLLFESYFPFTLRHLFSLFLKKNELVLCSVIVENKETNIRFKAILN